MPRKLLFILVFSLLILTLVHLAIGDVKIDWSLLWSTHSTTTSVSEIVFFELRLPRLILVLMVGAGLGFAGAAMQGLLRNLLADPALLGVSSGAALAAVMVIYYGVFNVWYAIPVAGVLGGLLATLAVFLLAGITQQTFSLILAGVAINALCTSGLALALNFAPNPYAMTEMVHWLLGSFGNRSFQDVQFLAPFLLAGTVLLLTQLKLFHALSLGDASAQTLGVNVKQSRLFSVIAIALIIGASVAVCGSIGFVGLVVPHLMRPWVKFDPAKTMFLSALAGAVILLSADLVVKLLATTQELKIGVVTALIGAPFFLKMIFSLRKRGA